MLSERMLSTIIEGLGNKYFHINPTNRTQLPEPKPKRDYMLYMHIPFCEVLCPYCSFNRFKFSEDLARTYFESLRKEMDMLKALEYDFKEVYVGGGTPTVLMDELERTVAHARELFPSIKDVSSETNPNHLVPEYLEPLSKIVQRLSVGVQSFNDDLLKKMDRYYKYGSAELTLKRVQDVAGMFKSLNVDMIFNFPGQTEEIIQHDIDMVKASGANQTTFYPLMVSPVSRRSIQKNLGDVDYKHEAKFYHMIYDGFCGGENPEFVPSSAYTFSRETDTMIDEYVVNYDEYPAIGSGGISYLDGSLFVNSFSLRDYTKRINEGHMSVMGETIFPKRDKMRYRFMMELFGLKLDKKKWFETFGTTVARGLPAEYSFMKLNGAFERDDDEMLTLTRHGRYLMVVMMREFFIGVNSLRDEARAALPGDEHKLVFGDNVDEISPIGEAGAIFDRQ
ncbi:MAG: coproporphyrinogen III oxidase family protein [Coriobacteriia bacterium]|nr:coproporphyrinogen III oxidase family protein [Coriobacteriia bacterium]